MSLVLFCLSVMVLMVAAEEQQPRKVMLCGRELARARVLLCFGTEYMYKRSSNYLSDDSDDKPWVWGGRRDALGARWARHKRGLVDECCLKACTPEVIRTYC
ncbi:hypothetical protein ABMA27_000836 [Loxostege sticticalis]|uniref:Insulin-like domain-containing protein n=1 Tax=Loxostege sticticalis TaxID=481309 RepID=A0ABR3I0H6_LOXSC